MVIVIGVLQRINYSLCLILCIDKQTDTPLSTDIVWIEYLETTERRLKKDQSANW